MGVPLAEFGQCPEYLVAGVALHSPPTPAAIKHVVAVLYLWVPLVLSHAGLFLPFRDFRFYLRALGDACPQAAP